MKPLKIAILDMNNNFPNEGMRCIRQLVQNTQQTSAVPLTYDVFNVRGSVEIPDLSYDIYISSGGPGSPLPTDEPWEKPFFALIDDILAWNQTQERKKHVFLICHSFQLVTRHLGIGVVSKRKSTSFGIFPMHKTEEGLQDPVLRALPEPFYSVDSRDYQVTQPNARKLEEMGVEILAIEKERAHVPLERALMAIRFTPEVVGTQFHPEADSEGMLRHFKTEEKRKQIVANYGEAKYHDMVRLLEDSNTIELTGSIVIPTFLQRAIAALAPAETAVVQSA